MFRYGRDRVIAAVLAAGVLLGVSRVLGAQATPQRSDTAGAPVVIDGDTLFRLYGRIGAFTPTERAAAAARRIGVLGQRIALRIDTIVVQDAEARSDLLVGDEVVMTVLDEDAQPLGIERAALARAHAARLTEATRISVERTSLKSVLLGVAYSLIALGILIALLMLLRRTVPRVVAALDQRRESGVPGLKIQRFELLSSSRMADVLIGLVRIVRAALTVVLLYVFVTTVLGFFPWTAPLASRIAGYVLNPLQRAAAAFAAYLPNVFFIAVVALITRYLLKALHLFFNALESGAVVLNGFDREWGQPTYKIVRFLVLAFVVVVIFPYLPGAGSDAFKGVSLFLGALFTLGSSSAIANVVAGAALTYTRGFRVGDRVAIGETTGDVIEQSLLVTRIRTIKNVDITIPNAMVLSTHIVNYSTMAGRGALILHTGVTIGYDVPWRQVHDTLITAAKATDGVLADPAPFVLQTSLDDFYVSYQLNVYTDKPSIMARTYSLLHANIQDSFNTAGLEILSPHYRAQRDGSMTTIPAEYLPKGYEAPRFRIETAEARP